MKDQTPSKTMLVTREAEKNMDSYLCFSPIHKENKGQQGKSLDPDMLKILLLSRNYILKNKLSLSF